MIQSPPSSPFPAIFNAYDGAGLRVKRVSNGGSSTTRVIFSGSKELAHYVNSTAPGSPTYEFIYAGSQLIAVTGGTAQAPWQRYLHQDHLSPRVITNESGGLARASGHYPFGEMWYEQIGNTPSKFTTYHRDPETGLDYALFRFHAPRLGRFQTPDPLAGSISNPQSLNRYSYVVNDPVNLVDPLGLAYCYYDPTIQATVCVGDPPPPIPLQPPTNPPSPGAEIGPSTFWGSDYPRDGSPFVPGESTEGPEVTGGCWSCPPNRDPDAPPPSTEQSAYDNCVKQAKTKARLTATLVAAPVQIMYAGEFAVGGGIAVGSLFGGPITVAVGLPAGLLISAHAVHGMNEMNKQVEGTVAAAIDKCSRQYPNANHHRGRT